MIINMAALAVWGGRSRCQASPARPPGPGRSRRFSFTRCVRRRMIKVKVMMKCFPFSPNIHALHCKVYFLCPSKPFCWELFFYSRGTLDLASASSTTRLKSHFKPAQELRMLSSVNIYGQVTMIIRGGGAQLSEIHSICKVIWALCWKRFLFTCRSGEPPPPLQRKNE